MFPILSFSLTFYSRIKSELKLWHSFRTSGVLYNVHDDNSTLSFSVTFYMTQWILLSMFVSFSPFRSSWFFSFTDKLILSRFWYFGICKKNPGNLQLRNIFPWLTRSSNHSLRRKLLQKSLFTLSVSNTLIIILLSHSLLLLSFSLRLPSEWKKTKWMRLKGMNFCISLSSENI